LRGGRNDVGNELTQCVQHIFNRDVRVARGPAAIWVETETRAIRPRARGALRFGNPH
jgi:hypothetical protein